MLLKISLLLSFLGLIHTSCTAQMWVDSLYPVQRTDDRLIYQFREAGYDYARLYADFYLPQGDTPPICGRPVVLLLHGGFFQFGDRKDSFCEQLAMDFASRGYVAVAMDYRLGLFKPTDYISCGASPEWPCLQTVDTVEWYRAVYKAGQDVHKTLNVLTDNHSAWNLGIDFRNVYEVGEDAGAMGALSAGFRHEKPEVNHPAYVHYAELDWPDPTYENGCITANAAPTGPPVDNRRWPMYNPYLDHYNWPPDHYAIRGIGCINGGLFDDLFYHTDSTSSPQPGIYFYHRPDNRMMPFGSKRILEEYVTCAASVSSCGSIANRPVIHGPETIRGWLATYSLAGIPVPPTQLDTLSGNSSCGTAGFSPIQHNHAVDDLGQLSYHLALFFATLLDSTGGCLTGIENPAEWLSFSVFPSPANHWISVQCDACGIFDMTLLDVSGKLVAGWRNVSPQDRLDLPNTLAAGLYFTQLNFGNGRMLTRKIMIGK